MYLQQLGCKRNLKMYGTLIIMLCLGTAICYEARNAHFMEIDKNLMYRPLGKFVYKPCNKTAVPILIKSLNVSPTPVQPGGKAHITADVAVTKTIAGKFGYDMYALLKFGDAYIELCPFVFKAAFKWDCKGEDVCAMLPKLFPTCPPVLEKAGFNCRCPFKPGNFRFPTTTLDVPNIPRQFQGQYKVTFMLNQADGAELMCAHMNFCFGKC